MSDLIGATLGPYRILEQIGRGGMATVYKAYHPATDRYVAVKILPLELADDPSFVVRFEREAKIVASLQHVHILPVFDYGQQGTVTYLVMPYVQTGTLKSYLATSHPGLQETARLFCQIADAVDFAHQKGVLHRDIKPANILLDDSGNALLTDFGLARMTQSVVSLTGSGGIIGTPSYMSPEQGQGLELDARSDIYSLGVVLYEMVVGEVPYSADTPVAVILKHVNQPLPLPRATWPDIPEAVERVILKALAKDPVDRFQTAGDMAEALRKAVSSAPPTETQQETRTKTAQGRKTSPVIVTADAQTQPSPRQAEHRKRFRWQVVAGIGLVLVAITVVVLASLNGRQSLMSPPTMMPSDTPPLAVVAEVSTESPTPATPIAQALRSIAARAGPGAEYPVVATLEANERLDIVGISEDGSWYQVLLPDGSLGWIAASAALIGTSGDLQVVPIAQAPTDTPTDIPTVTPSSIPTMTPDVFSTADAQSTLDTRATLDAQATAAQDTLNFQVTMTQIVIDLTATATQWTTTPSPIPLPTTTLALTDTPTNTATYTPQPTVTPILRPVPSSQPTPPRTSVLPFQLVPPEPSGRILYVDANANIAGNNQGDGTQASPFKTIQDAIEFAGDGDAILVAANIYDENLVIRRKRLMIEGGYAPTTWERPHTPEATVIDGGQRARVLWITDGAHVAISGFTVQNGYNACNGRSGGGGFAINGGNTEVIIARTVIRENRAEPPCGGGGIETNDSARVTVANSLIVHNSANDGAGIAIWTESHTLVINTTVTANLPDGINMGGQHPRAFVINSIFWDNGGRDIHPDAEVVNSMVAVSPHFVDPDAGDFHLRSDSPAVDDGIADGAPSIDLEGRPRPAGAGVDIGAYEFQPMVGMAPVVEGVRLDICAGNLCIFSPQGATPLPGFTANAYDGFSWSPDGTRFVFGACRGNQGEPCWDIYIANRDGTDIASLTGDSAPDSHSPAWSPDGEWIAYYYRAQLWLIRPDGTEAHILIEDVSRCPPAIAWSPDSQRLAWLAQNCFGNDPPHSVWVIERDGTGVRPIFEPDTPQFVWDSLIAWNPDGTHVAVSRQRGDAYLIDANCPSLPNGCDESTRTVIEAIPQEWQHNYYPQWGRP